MNIEDFVIGSLIIIYGIAVIGMLMMGFKAIEQNIRLEERIHNEQYKSVEYVF